MQVFLGGTAGNTTWRKAIAIPILEAAGVAYFNPQLGTGEWTPEQQKKEAAAKEKAEVWLFVITDETRGVASLVEAAYRIGCGGKMALVVIDVDEETMIDENYLSEQEIKDLNRGRAYLREIAEHHDFKVFKDIKAATGYAIQLLEKK